MYYSGVIRREIPVFQIVHTYYIIISSSGKAWQSGRSEYNGGNAGNDRKRNAERQNVNAL